MENANDLMKQLEPIKATVSKAEIAANNLEIKTKEDLIPATELLGKIKSVGKIITDKKMGMTKPINEALKNIRAFFAPVELKFNNAETIVKRKMELFNNIERAKAIKKTEVIEKKVEAGEMSFDKAAEKIEKITPDKTVETESGAVQFRTVREVVIEDEKLIPRDYLVLDMVKIRKVALAGVEIAGVKVIEKQIVAGLTR